MKVFPLWVCLSVSGCLSQVTDRECVGSLCFHLPSGQPARQNTTFYSLVLDPSFVNLLSHCFQTGCPLFDIAYLRQFIQTNKWECKVCETSFLQFLKFLLRTSFQLDYVREVRLTLKEHLVAYCLAASSFLCSHSTVYWKEYAKQFASQIMRETFMVI